MPNPQNPIFPTATSTDLDLMVATNRALSKLTNPIDGTQTQITVVDGTKFQVPCLVQIDTEIIKVGAISGNNFVSCTRGFGLTSSSSHGQNADVKGYVLSYHHNQLAAEIKAIEAGLGANFGNTVMQNDQAGGDLTGVFTNMHLIHNGVTAGTYGGFNTDTIISVDATGRVTQISDDPGNINYPIIYKAAIVQGSNAVLGFAFGNDLAPAAFIYDTTGTGNGLLYATARFTQGVSQWVQDHFYLPDDWQGDTVSLDIYWRSPATAGTVIWKVRVGGLHAGLGPDIVWNAWKFQTTTVPGTTLKMAKTRITPLTMTGVQPGDELFFEFARDASDTAADVADLVSIKFNINRNFALVQ